MGRLLFSNGGGTGATSGTLFGVVVSFGSGTGVPPVNGHGQDGRATANDTTAYLGGLIYNPQNILRRRFR